MAIDPNAPLVHSFTIVTELSHQQLLAFPKFVREHLAFDHIPGVKMGEMEALVGSKGHYVEFISGPQRGTYECLVRMYLERPIVVQLLSSQRRDEEFEEQLDLSNPPRHPFLSSVRAVTSGLVNSRHE